MMENDAKWWNTMENVVLYRSVSWNFVGALNQYRYVVYVLFLKHHGIAWHRNKRNNHNEEKGYPL